jgi:hypothetical protein
MANEEHLARLRTWIAERQVREGIRHTSQRVMARLRSTPWRELARRYQQLLMGLGALLLLLVTWKLPQWYAASWEKLTDPKDIARLESDTRSTMVQAVGGIALLAGLLFTWRNLRMTEQNSRQTLELSRKGQINDRFIKAIEQLGAVDQGGSKKLEVRLGGIYALEQIARDSPEDHHWPIMEILTAYVREHASWKEEEQPSQEEISPRETQPAQSNQSLPKLAPDIQAILTVLGRRGSSPLNRGEVRLPWKIGVQTYSFLACSPATPGEEKHHGPRHHILPQSGVPRQRPNRSGQHSHPFVQGPALPVHGVPQDVQRHDRHRLVSPADLRGDGQPGGDPDGPRVSSTSDRCGVWL